MGNILPLFYSLDIETFGTNLDAQILEIGICQVCHFIEGTQSVIYDTSTVSLHWPTDASGHLHHVKGKDLLWHLQQTSGTELIKDCLESEYDLVSGWCHLLSYFKLSIAEPSDVPWFFRGPQFDATILEHQLTAIEPGIVMPWKYYKVEDERTLTKHAFQPHHEYPRPTRPAENHHRAGGDAKYQAQCVVDALKNLSGSEDTNKWFH